MKKKKEKDGHTRTLARKRNEKASAVDNVDYSINHSEKENRRKKRNVTSRSCSKGNTKFALRRDTEPRALKNWQSGSFSLQHKTGKNHLFIGEKREQRRAQISSQVEKV